MVSELQDLMNRIKVQILKKTIIEKFFNAQQYLKIKIP